jgi:hypothetical protein
MRWPFLLLLIAPIAGAAGAPIPTFSKDVAPILYKHCAGCHRPNDIAPMSLITYKEARPWAKSIREAVVKRAMPPWHADSRYGHFSNDPRLTDAEIATIRGWVDQGSPEGDPADLPKAPQFEEGWKIGKPDLVIDIGEDHRIDPTGPDEYTYFTVPTNFKEDRWVKAVELRPGNRKVVHHAHVWSTVDPAPGAKQTAKKKDWATTFMYRDGQLTHMKPDAPVQDDGCAVQDAGNFWGRREGQNGILGSYLPGRGPDQYAEGTAKLIPAGAKLTFQIHYSRTTGKTEFDRTEVGFVFAPPPARPLKRMDISNYLFRIPAGNPSHEVTECHTFDKDIELLSLTGHMHYRGKDMRFDLVRPNGRQETLLFISHYSFAWQTIYRLAEPVFIEKGSRLKITAHFDNSANNKWNPDPSKTIRWGEPSNEEMMDGWLEYVDASPRAGDSISSSGTP